MRAGFGQKGQVREVKVKTAAAKPQVSLLDWRGQPELIPSENVFTAQRIRKLLWVADLASNDGYEVPECSEIQITVWLVDCLPPSCFHFTHVKNASLTNMKFVVSVEDVIWIIYIA